MRSRTVATSDVDGTEKVAVVIDVMRAFTTAAWVFHRGADRIVLAADGDRALALKASNPGWLALKDGTPARGFDLTNSPELVRRADLAGRTVVQTTTAGTVGALAVTEAEWALCGSFVVAGATARLLASTGADAVTFVATGEGGRAAEDRACADYLAELLGGGHVDPAPYVRRARDSTAAQELRDGRRHGSRSADVGLCLEVDRFDFAMRVTLKAGMAVLRPVAARPGAGLAGHRAR
ncbi:2-phosphosulfolactate phosphatase [Streptomyces sp. NBC_00178]|uniref:2-phosphosulfolactate phosphatase n=1 Tax=Streptomyces sp. NBC_00178 TaxID=2975672 RepID=UPI002E289B27|nr:2-phosphosulfolactate phosphatase [Streptomyces sp. NBC_00178]